MKLSMHKKAKIAAALQRLKQERIAKNLTSQMIFAKASNKAN